LLSGLVYAAAAQVSNRFQLCASVACATRKLHVPSTPVGTTIGEVLNTMATGKYEPAKKMPTPSAEFRAAVRHDLLTRHAASDDASWGMLLHPEIFSAELHRLLAGMR